jgi:four helix bundle protein
MSKPHKQLIAWQKAMQLVEKIYEITRKLPRDEIYGLTSQLRRAAVSVPSNIAEGAAGRSSIQFRNYLSVAIGSLNELATQLEILWRILFRSPRRSRRGGACRRVFGSNLRTPQESKITNAAYCSRLTAHCLLL